MAKRKSPNVPPQRDIARNRRATFDYEIVERMEAGLVLLGSEIKGLRERGGTIGEAYVVVRGAEAWLVGAHISEYGPSPDGHDPTRTRKLLLHRREITELAEQLDRKGLAVVPLRLYFKDGRAKLEIGIGRGRAQHDKRRAIREREDRREADRATRAARRR
jgi:SsrA-binding protein